MNTTKRTASVKKTSNVKKEEENKKLYEDLENELNGLKEMIKNLSISKDEPENKETKIETITQEFVEIHPNIRIKVVSLVDGILILTAGEPGKGKPFRFDKFGVVKMINYNELVEILHYNYSFAEQGLFYIYNDNVISNHGLQDIYSKILSKEQIENLLTMKNSEAIELFKNTTNEQHENIVSIIINKINSGEDVDYNKIESFGKIYGKNINDMASEFNIK